MTVFVFTTNGESRASLEKLLKLEGYNPIFKDDLNEVISLITLIGHADFLLIDKADEDKLTEVFFEEIRGKVNSLHHFIDSKDAIKTVTMVDNQKDEKDNYSKVSLNFLAHFPFIPFDLFIKISNDVFIKRIPAFEDIDPPLIHNLREKEVINLFYKRTYRKEFSNLLINHMINRMEHSFSDSSDSLKAVDEVFLTTKDIVKALGFKPRIVELCERMMSKIQEDILSNSDQFSEYLNLIINSKTSFCYRFMELTCMIASQVNDIREGSESDLRKIIFAAIFCDIGLNNKEHVHIRSESEAKRLSPIEEKNVLQHAYISSELIAKYPNAPSDVEKIIRQHHGALNGIGFPDSLTSWLCPLSKRLLIAQEIAYGLLTEKSSSLSDIFSNITTRYSSPTTEVFLNDLQQGILSQTKIQKGI